MRPFGLLSQVLQFNQKAKVAAAQAVKAKEIERQTEKQTGRQTDSQPARCPAWITFGTDD